MTSKTFQAQAPHGEHASVLDTVALVAPLLSPGSDVQAGHHHGHVRQHGDQQQDLDVLALARLMHAEAQSEQGTFDIAKAFLDLHALSLYCYDLVRQR